MILTRKRRLRLLICQQTALLPRGEKLRQAGEAFARLEQLDTFRKAANVGIFWSLSDEIPTQDFIEKWAPRKNLCLPVVYGKEMKFARFTPGCNMVQGGLRILVPQGTPHVDPAELDLLIVPGVAFDPYGGRLGRGQGFYDRFFEKTEALKIGICLDHQMVGEVPLEGHDKKTDAVITPGGIYFALESKAGATESRYVDPSVQEQPPTAVRALNNPA